MDQHLLERLLVTQSASGNDAAMIKAVKRELRAMGVAARRHHGNLYAVKGTADVYPCFVAHLDTVHRVVPSAEYQVQYDAALGEYWGWNPVQNRFTGIGGDDKVGIFLALSLIAALPACKIAFFRDEEIGCRGSALADHDFFVDCAFILQADRLGNADFVVNGIGVDLSSSDFQTAVGPILARHDFQPVNGGLTDVVQLTEDSIGISTANLSCGYYNPHSDEEYIVLADVERAYNLMLGVAQTLGSVQWPHEFVDHWTDYATSGKYAGYFIDAGLCPRCGDSGELAYDDTLGTAYCWGCFEYVDVLPDDTRQSNVFDGVWRDLNPYWQGKAIA